VLILTRHPGESLIIETPAGERITGTVLGVKCNHVRIGTGTRKYDNFAGRAAGR
jgi:sRNA-binding carbon storage regulator CsrA